MESKPIAYKRWIPAEWPEGTNSANQYKPGHYPLTNTGCYETGFSLSGTFLGWGISYEETNKGIAHYTVALVCTAEGTVEQLPIQNIKFV